MSNKTEGTPDTTPLPPIRHPHPGTNITHHRFGPTLMDVYWQSYHARGAPLPRTITPYRQAPVRPPTLRENTPDRPFATATAEQIADIMWLTFQSSDYDDNVEEVLREIELRDNEALLGIGPGDAT